MKTLRKHLSVLLCLIMILGTAAVGGNTGIMSSAESDKETIPEGYIPIYNSTDLYLVRNNLNANYILMNDIDLTDELADNGDLNDGNGWTPIGVTGTDYEPFTGVFDGNNHTITGLRFVNIKLSSGFVKNNYCSGFFGYNSGEIKNINFKNVVFESQNYVYNKEWRFGTVTGINNGSITNCNVSGSYSLFLKNISGSPMYIGGITGSMGAFSVIKKCISNIDFDLNLTSTGNNYKYIYIGGICGSSAGIIDECGYVGSSYIYLTTSTTYQYYTTTLYFGGITGRSTYSSEKSFTSSITNCYSSISDGFSKFPIPSDNPIRSTKIVGGISGICFGLDKDNVTTLKNTYCASIISGDKTGGVIGYSGNDYFTTENAYYNSKISHGVGEGIDSGTQKSEGIMKKKNGLQGFDYENIWILYPCSNYKYPQLRSNPMDTSSDNHFCKNPIAQVDATCEENGFIRGICDGCGTEFTQILPALGHDFSEEFTVDKKADCENDGSKSKHCSRCEAKKDETVISASGHDFSPWEIITESTSCEEGEMSRTCANCLKTETKKYAASEHIIVTDKAVKPTCTEDGLTEGSHCSVCHKVLVKQEIIKATGHDIVIDKPQAATCTENGLTEGCHCKTCGEIITEQKLIPAAHSFTNYIYNNDATMEHDGTETAKCDRCEATNTRTKAGTKIIPVDVDPQAGKKVSITNYKQSLDVDYKSTVIIHANVPEGYTAKWSNGQTGSECKLDTVTNKNYVITCYLEKGGKEIDGTESSPVIVNVDTGFFAKIVAFFRGLFKTLPTYIDFKKS